ncbi:uncharacterized protein LOC123542395 isoform X1 [Mercenaria mercenaria]|uniref:uncharacterized protein LOC123542395 isoform X1 n=1 Tax=Mercenaria mercenaria TaxID=6596 RepID=UPI00234F2570|nr:uncharacterized protein LOC123542395 isoform X1 [Mercenaria mercenaria]
MAYIWSRDVWILLYILAVQNVAQIVPETEDGKTSFERRFLLDQTSSAYTSVPTPTKVTTPQVQSTDCFYDSTKYMGSFATTVTGKTCKNWVDLDPSLQGFPDISITVARNMCRDLDGRGFPWCFTSNTFDWEFCPVPYCQECFYPSQSVQYAGYVAIDKDNNTCSSWTDYVSQTGDTLVKFLNETVADAKNYCRDPKDSGTPQCYVNGVLQNCDVPQCTHDCRDDPETSCALVQQYVCKYEYTSATLCPKTCNMCKFGLLPPKSVDPPADICVDNPDANCDILQFIICADTDGALNLCPKTCQLCSLLYSRTTVGPATSTVQAIATPIQTTQTTIQTTITSPTMTSPMTSAATTSTPSTTTPPSTTPTTTTPTTTPSPYWLPWGVWGCKEQSGSCFQKRLRNCSTGLEQDCKTSQGGIGYNVGLCTEVSCPEFFTTTTTVSTKTQANISLEQFASCYLTCVSGFKKLTETCCKTGIDAVCSNLPWNLLKPRLGSCPGLLVAPAPAVWTSLEQFAACSLTCVPGYEKLTEVCCQTGMDVVCSNLPWALLKNHLGTCHDSAKMTSPIPLFTMTSTITTSSTPSPYWMQWGVWECKEQSGSCFQKRERNCSTGLEQDCKNSQGGIGYNVGLCTEVSCPDFFTTTTVTVQSTTLTDTCQDNHNSVGCGDKDILTEICREKTAAWSLCRRSCGLCDTCWDYLNCSTPGAQKLFCGREEYAVQYCRQTCGKCDHKPVDVHLNKCGDPVASELVCELLQAEICVCNDLDVRPVCRNYCDNKCADHPFAGSDCIPAKRKRRDAFLSQVLLH